MVGFKASTEENLFKKKKFYNTIKTQEFYIGYMIINRSQYGHHWWPYKCIACIQFPPKHKKVSMPWLFQ
jgi:hypothetical protein